MADVQLEKGYTRVADELLEALSRARIPGQDLRIMLAIIRLTYGFQRKDDVLPASQLGEMCGMGRRRVCDILKRLEQMKMIHRQHRGDRKPSRIGPNKDFESWELKGAMLTPSTGLADPQEQASQHGPNSVPPDPHETTNLTPVSRHTKERERVPERARAKRRPSKLDSSEIEEYAQTLYLKTGVSALDGFRPLTQRVLDSCMTRRPGTRAESVVRWYAFKIPDLLDRPTKPENLGKAASNWFGMACQGLSKIAIDDQLRAAMKWAAEFDRVEAREVMAAECRELEAKAKQEREARASAAGPQQKLKIQHYKIPVGGEA